MRRLLRLTTVASLGLLLGATPAWAATKAPPTGSRAGSVVPGEANGPGDQVRMSCDEGRWPLTAQGEPAGFDAGDRAGYRIWHDLTGWHLRTTTPSTGDHVFRGVIRSADDIQIVAKYQDERVDDVRVEGRLIAFEFHTHNGVDGLDFVVGCTDHVSFNLQANDEQVPNERIWLGRNGRAPGNPFTVYRGR